LTGHGGSIADISCLVLGAGGFIGSHLCHALVTAGARVHGFGHPPAYADSLPGVRFTPGSLTDVTALADALCGIETVFHLIGSTLPDASNRDPATDVQLNTVASIRMIELCRGAGIRKIVFASSGGTVYGNPGSIPITESAPTNPISSYGINKLATEKYLQLYARMGGPRAVSLRIANPFGPYQSPLRGQGLVPAIMHKVLMGKPIEIWGDGSVVRDYVFVSDVADALVAAALYEGCEPVLNIGSGIGRSILGVLSSICEALEQPGPEIVFRSGRQADVPANVLDISLAAQVLPWNPQTDWLEGLLKTATWITRTHG
jgi:UDP-glucose 4-epimerase